MLLRRFMVPTGRSRDMARANAAAATHLVKCIVHHHATSPKTKKFADARDVQLVRYVAQIDVDITLFDRAFATVAALEYINSAQGTCFHRSTCAHTCSAICSSG